MGALRAVNHLLYGSDAFDWALRLLVGVDLFKMGVPVVLLMYVWLRPRDPDPGVEVVLRSALAVLVAIALGRLLQDTLPWRERPVLALHGFPFPTLGGLTTHGDSSSFPSDHAVLSFAIATAIFAFSCRLGLVAYAWAALIVCLPRMYFGYHYLTDLLAGAVVGVLATALVLRLPVPEGLRARLRRLDARAPVALTLGCFLLGFEMLGLFQGVRGVLRAARDVVTALYG